MDKIILIIQREYLARVRKKSFIIMSILGPLLFGGIMGYSIWLAASDSSEERVISVVDESGLFEGKLSNEGSMQFVFSDNSLEAEKAAVTRSEKYGVLYEAH